MKSLKILVITLLVIVILAILVFISLVFEKPWWLGPSVMIALGAGAVGVWFTFLGLKKFINWLWGIRPSKKLYITELSRNWKNAISSIRKSDLKNAGDSLYVLPWYLVLGEKGAGKTCAIANSGLRSRITAPFSRSENTENCQWKFFEQAIVLDAPGRYAIHENDYQDNDEWKAFLSLFLKYRDKEPLNGVVVTIAADTLLDLSHEALEQRANGIRKSIQDIPEKLGVRVPIYIMVTKCDLIKGTKNFFSLLPEDKLSQAMGQLNNEEILEVGEFSDQTVAKLIERLKNLRLSLSFYGGSQSVNASAFFFPEEFSKIKSGLRLFVESVFQESVYESVPVLRGIFFTSAKQSPAPQSRLLNNFKNERKTALPNSAKSMFISDLFGKIFPVDRNRVVFTKERLRRRRLLRYLRIAAASCLVAFVMHGVYKAYEINRTAISQVKEKLDQSMELGENVQENVDKLDSFLKNIFFVYSQVEESLVSGSKPKMETKSASAKKSSWIGEYLVSGISSWENTYLLPLFMMNQGRDSLIGLRKKYCLKYRKHMLYRLNEKIENSIEEFHGDTSEKTVGNIALYLMERIKFLNSIRSLEEEVSEEDIEKLLPPDGTFNAELLGIDSSLYEQLEEQYKYYLLWVDENALEVEFNVLEKSLKSILSHPEIPLNWIASLADLETSDADVKLKSFWNGSRRIHENILVSHSNTLKGKKWMDQKISELEALFPEYEVLDNKIEEFQFWHRNRFFEAWLDFISNFDKGSATLENWDEKYSALTFIRTDSDPYFRLIETLLENASAFEESEFPLWTKLLGSFEAIRKKARKEEAAEKANKGLARLAIVKKANRWLKGIKVSPKSVKALRSYLSELDEAKRESTGACFDLVKRTFEGIESSSFIKADKDFIAFKQMLPAIPLSPGDKKIIMDFLRGQFRYLWEFAVENASLKIQKLWEGQVASKFYDIRASEKVPKLFGEQGHVRLFMNKTIKPFMHRNSKDGSFSPVNIFEKEINFSSAFIELLNDGYARVKAVDKRHEVIVRWLPTEAKGGKLWTSHTRLKFKNGKSTYNFINYQNDLIKKLTLNPYMKSYISLRVQIGDISLTKEYAGDYALESFIKDFSNGSHVFKPKDFSDHERGELTRARIRGVEINIDLKDNNKLLKLIETKIPELPRTIILS